MLWSVGSFDEAVAAVVVVVVVVLEGVGNPGWVVVDVLEEDELIRQVPLQ